MTMQIIEEGPRNLVINFQGLAAGGDTVDVSALSPPCEELRIDKIFYDAGPDVVTASTIQWDATAPVTAWTLHGHSETFCFDSFGGIPNNAGAGVTGDVIVTRGADDVSLIIWFKKVRAQHPFPN